MSGNNEAPQSMAQKQMKIAMVVAAYFAISISLVFVNKILMDKKTSMDAPLFMTWFQCVITVLICWILGEIGQTAAPGSFFKQFPKFAYKTDTAWKLLPLTLIFVSMITFNNLCLKYVEVSFYNVARSLTIVFNVILTWFMLGQKTSGNTLIMLGVVVLGFFVGSEGEVNFSMIGTIFGVTSSVFVSLNSIMTKKGMDLVDRNEWALSGYNNMNACLIFLPIILLSNEPAIIMANWHLLVSGRYWFLMTVGGVFGFMIGIVTILQIKVTSPLTHNISGTAKACVQTVLALIIWQNPTNFTNMLGVFLVLGGSMGYSYVRTQEMQAADQQKKLMSAKTGGGGAEAGIAVVNAGGKDAHAHASPSEASIATTSSVEGSSSGSEAAVRIPIVAGSGVVTQR
jgi:solute carrier family 35 (GDP-fucose transporter), member C1